jgi:hypothetical protein
MSRRNVLVGQYGTIPDDIYLRKIETTNEYLDPSEVNNYMRNQLSDFRPDAPTFASDLPRSANDLGGGTHGRERLNLLHSGARSTEEPYLPEGSFIDHEFLERDPRGTENLPNFAEHKRQRVERGVFLKKHNDDDYTITETGINPNTMSRLIRGSQNEFKDRYQNFTESYGSMATVSTFPAQKTSTIPLVTHDGTIINVADAPAHVRSDAVNRISNNLPGVMRLNTPDHRVKVSKYGMVRPILEWGANDWRKNRQQGEIGHDVVDYGGQLINRGLANLIYDIESQRKAKQETNGVNFTDGFINKNKTQQVIDPKKIQELMNITNISHFMNNSNENNINSKMNMKNVDVRNIMNKSDLSLDMANSIAQVNKVQYKKTDNLTVRENVLDSMAKHQLDVLNKKQMGVKKVLNTLNSESIDNRYKEESKKTKNYGMVKAMKTDNNALIEPFKNGSMNTNVRGARFKLDKLSINPDTEETADEFEPAPIHEERNKKFYGRSFMDGDMEHNDSYSSRVHK